MQKIIAMAALALLLPIMPTGVSAQDAKTDEAQEKFENRRLRDDMRRRQQTRDRRREQQFQDEQEAKKEERRHRQRMEETREGNRHQRDIKRANETRETRERAEAEATRAAEMEAEQAAAIASSDPGEPSVEAEALQEIEEIIEETEGEVTDKESLILFSFDGEPSRRQSYEWGQDLPETGTFLFEWTYTFDGADYKASTELDVGFIPDGDKAYLPLAQHIDSNERDAIRNYETEQGIIQLRGYSLVYAAFLNRTGLNFRFNAGASRAAGYSRFRDIRISRVEHGAEGRDE